MANGGFVVVHQLADARDVVRERRRCGIENNGAFELLGGLGVTALLVERAATFVELKGLARAGLGGGLTSRGLLGVDASRDGLRADEHHGQNGVEKSALVSPMARHDEA